MTQDHELTDRAASKLRSALALGTDYVNVEMSRDEANALIMGVSARGREPVAWQFSTFDPLDGWGGWQDIRPGDLETMRRWVAQDPQRCRIRDLYAAPAVGEQPPKRDDGRNRLCIYQHNSICEWQQCAAQSRCCWLDYRDGKTPSGEQPPREPETAYLGHVTTQQLMDELRARGGIGEAWAVADRARALYYEFIADGDWSEDQTVNWIEVAGRTLNEAADVIFALLAVPERASPQEGKK